MDENVTPNHKHAARTHPSDDGIPFGKFLKYQHKRAHIDQLPMAAWDTANTNNSISFLLN